MVFNKGPLDWESSTLITRPQSCNFIIKETLAQVFSCEFCETFKNNFLTASAFMLDVWGGFLAQVYSLDFRLHVYQ